MLYPSGTPALRMPSTRRWPCFAKTGLSFSGPKAKTLNGEQRIKRQSGSGFGSRLLQLAETGQRGSKKKVHERKIGIEFDSTTKPYDGLFVHPKLHLSAAGKVHPSHALLSRGESRSASILVTFGFFATAVE